MNTGENLPLTTNESRNRNSDAALGQSLELVNVFIFSSQGSLKPWKPFARVHVQKVLIWFIRPSNRIFIRWARPFKLLQAWWWLRGWMDDGDILLLYMVCSMWLRYLLSCQELLHPPSSSTLGHTLTLTSLPAQPCAQGGTQTPVIRVNSK